MQNISTTLQIATFGPNDYESIALGLRIFPIHKIALICYDYDKSQAHDFATKIKVLLGIPISVDIVTQQNVIQGTIEHVHKLLVDNSKDISQVLMNISSGEKLLGCAALSAAFVYGIKAFGLDRTKTQPILMPILKLSYNELISEAKIKILKSIIDMGGSIESLEQLEKISGFGKPLLSYHIQGGKDSKGLAELGLVNVERKERGKISASVTTLGRMLIFNSPIKI